jgi:hypothetical protein
MTENKNNTVATPKKARLSLANKLNIMREMLLAEDYLEAICTKLNLSESTFYRLWGNLCQIDGKLYTVNRSPASQLARAAKISPEGSVTLSAANIALLGLSHEYSNGKKVTFSREGKRIYLEVMPDKVDDVEEKDIETADTSAPTQDPTPDFGCKIDMTEDASTEQDDWEDPYGSSVNDALSALDDAREEVA